MAVKHTSVRCGSAFGTCVGGWEDHPCDVGFGRVVIHGSWGDRPSSKRAPQNDGSSPVVIYLYLPDPDLAIEAAVQAGASVSLPAADQPWGDRVGRIMDPAGHVWNIARRGPANV